MTEQDVELGDRVRLTYEGTVTNTTSSGFGLDDGSYFGRPAAHGSRRVVEILEKRPPQVGDVINSRRELGSLPGGSVVTNRDGHALIVRHGRTYAPSLSGYDIHTRTIADGYGNPPYRVIYIP